MADTSVLEVLGSKADTIDVHLLSVEDLCQRFNTNIETGLTEEQAKENLEKYGLTNIKDMPECILVKRSGQISKIMFEELTLGDIVYLNPTGDSGSWITADVRIITMPEQLYVESAFLYKDCLNYIKEMTTENTSEDPLVTGNLAFAGTFMFAGSCMGLVFQTGDNTLLSNIDRELLVKPKIEDEDDENREKMGWWRKIWTGGKKLFGLGDKEEPREEMSFTFHEDTIEKICEMFNTDIEKGLTTEQVEKNQEESGRNKYHKYREIQDYAMCKRDGTIQKLLSRNLTVGDIITLKAPQIVPADIRIVELSPDCKVDASGLTGQQSGEEMMRSTESTSANPLETKNVAFATTKIVKGSCTGIVVQVGKRALISQLPAPTVMEAF